eukprot:g20226.t1
MGAVELVGNTKSIYETSDCPGVLKNQDKTSYVADLGRGQTYTVKWTVTSCSSMKDPIASAAWIDFNRDDSFDSSERLNPNPVTDYDTKEITFTVPVTAVLGNTIMRVQAQETTQTSQPLDPCFSFRWGGTKDFSIEITEPMKGGGKGSRSQGGLSGGSQILIVLFSFAFVYIVGGVAWNKRQGHEGCRSVFPHYDFWCIHYWQDCGSGRRRLALDSGPVSPACTQRFSQAVVQ